jgi:DNA polymerase III epsilon subunit-like protein
MVCLCPCAAAAQANLPSQTPQDWVLAIIDVETTGLEPGHHEMVDIGAIYTTLEGEELGRFFVRIHPDHPERAGEIARSINGFDEDRWVRLGAVDEADAAQAFLDFHARMTTGRTALFTAYNAYFDRGFVDAWLKEEGHGGFRDLFTHYVLDLPSLGWGAGHRELDNAALALSVGVEPETEDPLEHTGLRGAAFNLQLYRALTASASPQE